MRKTPLNKLEKAVSEFKKDFILKNIRLNGGNAFLTANKLGIHRNVLVILIKELNLYKDIERIIKERRDRGEVLKYSTSTRKEKTNKLKEAVQKYEKKYLKEILEKTNGSETKTARLLGTHRNTILSKVRRLNLLDYKNKVLENRRRTKWDLNYYHTSFKPKLHNGSFADEESRNIGKKLLKARAESGFSLKKLEKISGVNSNYISFAERGLMKIDRKYLDKLAKALKISIK